MNGLWIAPIRRCGNVQPAPSLALDFINTPAIPSGFTFSRASTATYFTAGGLLVSVGTDVPRFDHDFASGAALGLQLESSRANVLGLSTGMYIATRCTLTQHEGIGADGSLTTTLITEDATPASTHYASEAFPVSANMPMTFSGYFRADSRTQGCLFVDSAGWSSSNQALAIFDLSSATVVELWNCTGGVQKINNCLLRGWLTATSSTTVSGARALAMPAKNGQNSYDGAGGTVETWGWQVESNTNEPSSYMPTAGAAFTRAADYLWTSQLVWLNATEGTAVIDGVVSAVKGGGTFLFSLDDGINNGIGIYKVNGSGNLTAYSGGANSTGLGVTLADGQRARAAIAWSNAGASASAAANGCTAVPVTSAGAVNASEFCIGSARGRQFSGMLWVRSFTYWPYRMADRDLAALTAVPAT
ncbi:phage head spike fiber domain-containing protein [Paraburkholderia sp. J10-1]|uniref:phage head spike fiber domain-containing protein n=1 Tax=Paraburkholderia sp. J10-1 TaxID=2805430 RepID=UPI002AB5F7F4|nr:hypothetical protein [Paraburkholderia sp. J10-1]